MKKLTRKHIEQVLDAWEQIANIEQYQDQMTTKERNALYDKVRDVVNENYVQ